ncbi:I78 family peptidase inhibitor [Gymnodinialimonas sp. 2305UL16-5]|uniref:I78 family peptidase inhibitor n=1 Tax=Gymnodinialimonas mytili TaxID=3126503 RepID=UPI0030AA3C4E
MTFRSKTLIILLLSLTPAIASAQVYPNYNFGDAGIGGVNPGYINGVYPPAATGGQPLPVVGTDCGATLAQHYVGHSAEDVPVVGGARVIGPDTIVTQEYNPNRLNLATDGNGIITRAYCG